MIRRLSQFLEKAYYKQVDGTGLAIFRIAYCAVLLCEIFQIFYFRHLIFDKVPFLEPAEINFGIPIAIWAISVFLIMVGLFTRTASLVNYIMSLVLIGSINTYEYHVFYAYMGINFLLMFLPVNRCLSIDRVRLSKILGKNLTLKVRQIHYYLPIFIAVGLVYLDSIFIKSTANSWISGLGMWMPASFPMMVHSNLSFILNIKYLMIFLGYMTLAFEAIFIWVFFRKNWRIPILIVGAGLHIGILILFPIPWFALTVCAIYILLIPISFWRNLFNYSKYDSEDTLDVNTVDIYFSNPNFKTYKIFVYFALILQILIIYDSPLITNFKEKISLSGSGIDRGITAISRKIKPISKTFFGITSHGVFIDKYHYNGYNHIIAIEYKGKNDFWLPIIDRNGQPSYYNYSGNWRKMSFSTNNPNINLEELKKGVRDFTAFWACKNGVDLNDATFEIKVKKISSPEGWEYDFLNKQIAQPWISGGYVKWENQKFIPYIKDIESL